MGKIEEIIQRIAGSSLAVVVDVDDTVLASSVRWLNRFNSSFGLNLSIAMIKKTGGLSSYLRRHPEFESFREMLEMTYYDKDFHIDLAAIRGAVTGIDRLKEANIPLGGYLTARPEELTNITSKNLVSLGFPDAPVCARPKNVENNSTLEWKTETLRRIANSYDGQLVMIDDKQSLQRVIADLNSQLKIPIVFILCIGNLRYDAWLELGIEYAEGKHSYVASWYEIPEICISLRS